MPLIARLLKQPIKYFPVVEIHPEGVPITNFINCPAAIYLEVSASIGGGWNRNDKKKQYVFEIKYYFHFDVSIIAFRKLYHLYCILSIYLPIKKGQSVPCPFQWLMIFIMVRFQQPIQPHQAFLHKMKSSYLAGDIRLSPPYRELPLHRYFFQYLWFSLHFQTSLSFQGL